MKGDTLRADTAALAAVCTSSGNMESTDDVEHFLLEGIHVCFLCAVKLGAVKYAFAAAAGRTCITAGVAADAFAKLLLEKR